mgnify:CR=1 FL=1
MEEKDLCKVFADVGLARQSEIIGKEFLFVFTDQEFPHVIGGTITGFDVEFGSRGPEDPEDPDTQTIIALFVGTPSIADMPIEFLEYVGNDLSHGHWEVYVDDDDEDNVVGNLTVL